MGIVIDAGTDWTLTTLDVIKGALQLCQAIGVGENVNDDDATLCLTALDGVLKELPIHGFQRPKISSAPVAVTWSSLTPSVAYPPGDYFGAPVLKFTDASTQKKQLRQVAKAEWETLITQTAAYPEIVYVSPDLTFNLWPTPTQDPGLTLTYQSILPDLILTGATGLEQQYVNGLQFLLADEISLKYGVSPADRAEIAARATQKKFKMLQWATDLGPICITVDD
jgi:hypothetical protein